MSQTSLIGTKEAVRRSGIPRSTFHRRVSEGMIPVAAKVEGKTGAMLFDPEVIDSLKAGSDK